MHIDVKQNRFLAQMDKSHVNMGICTGILATDVWRDKYRWADEADYSATAARVVSGVYAHDNEEHAQQAYEAIASGLWLPAGRILAGAGTPKRVTLMNCYVNSKMEDAMESILDGVSYAALTMQQGGGMGTDFTPIRPEGAILRRTHTKASGPLPFMDMWHSMCDTIRSAGDRRGAMMGTLGDTHPDIPKFIVAKQVAGKLTNFNISILVSDALMDAVKEDEDWFLHFHVPPFERSNDLEQYDFEDDDGVKQYVYSKWKARDLWALITKNTYEWSEPGVIFIDRINELNNLWYCEEIRCTNPCGEQPLPPHGTCNLGALNLSRFVKNPFTIRAEFDWELLKKVTAIGVRFLDNVIEVTNYPLKEQMQEEYSKRRLGLGFTGLADAMAQLGIRYGSLRSADFAENVQWHICNAAYRASIELAKERKPFPLFKAEEYLAPQTFAGKMLPKDIQDEIREHGIRNGLLLTVAPTGTTSLVVDNPASGVEPIFLHQMQRKVRQGDGSWKPYTEWAYSAKLYKSIHGDNAELPSYMVTAMDLTIEEHILIQGRIQRWVDASVSKTINVAEDCSYEDFVRVYELAYTSGCKGCTTYRPSAVRGSILSAVQNESDKPPQQRSQETINALRPRPDFLHGTTYKVKWPRRSAALYLTINSDEEGTPHEIFIASKDATNAEWTTSLSIMITAIFRKGGNVDFIADELQQVQAMNDGAWMATQDGKSKFFGSLPAYLGYLIGQHLNPTASKAPLPIPMISISPQAGSEHHIGETCPKCSAPAVVHQEGCKKCTSCGWSECG